MPSPSASPRHPEARGLDLRMKARIQELVLSGVNAAEAIHMAGEEFREKSLELVTGKHEQKEQTSIDAPPESH